MGVLAEFVNTFSQQKTSLLAKWWAVEAPLYGCRVQQGSLAVNFLNQLEVLLQQLQREQSRPSKNNLEPLEQFINSFCVQGKSPRGSLFAHDKPSKEIALKLANKLLTYLQASPEQQQHQQPTFKDVECRAMLEGKLGQLLKRFKCEDLPDGVQRALLEKEQLEQVKMAHSGGPFGYCLTI